MASLPVLSDARSWAEIAKSPVGKGFLVRYPTQILHGLILWTSETGRGPFMVKVADYSPPELPSLAQQRDAIKKGLGRAMQWAIAGRLEDSALLDACLHDMRFDALVDDSRGAWLWQLIQTVHAVDRFRSPLLDAMQEFSDGWTTEQLCELAFHYALAGDGAFRARLYEIVERRPFPDMPWIGEESLVQLDAEQGFAFAARLRGQRLERQAFDWDDLNLIEFASKRFGEDRARELLNVSNDPALTHFRDGWLHYQSEPSNREHTPHSERMRQIPISEIISEAESESRSCGTLRGWGMHADAQNLEIIRQRLLTAQTPPTIANYLRVFSNREYIPLVPNLLDLCRHDDDEVRQRAFAALSKNSHPSVHQFAQGEIQKGIHDGSVISLYVANYQQGDEQRILEFLELPEDEGQLHWMLMQVTEVLEKNHYADASHLGMLAYALTPCGTCRFHAVRLLQARKVLPSWVLEECQFDAEADTRELVAK